MIFCVLFNDFQKLYLVGSCACVSVPPFVVKVMLVNLSSVSVISINIMCTVYIQATGFDSEFLLVAFHCIAIICNYCFLLCIIN